MGPRAIWPAVTYNNLNPRQRQIKPCTSIFDYIMAPNQHRCEERCCPRFSHNFANPTVLAYHTDSLQHKYAQLISRGLLQLCLDKDQIEFQESSARSLKCGNKKCPKYGLKFSNCKFQEHWDLPKHRGGSDTFVGLECDLGPCPGCETSFVTRTAFLRHVKSPQHQIAKVEYCRAQTDAMLAKTLIPTPVSTWQ